MRFSTKIVLPVLAVMMVSACGKKDNDKSQPQRRSPAPEERRDTETKQQEQQQAKKDEAQKNQQTGVPAAPKQETAQKPMAPLTPPGTQTAPARTPPQTPLPPPSSGSSQPPARDPLEAAVPSVSPLDTFGGQLITAYLGGEVSGEQVIAQVFDNDDLVMSNLAEMSVAVRKMRDENRYSPTDQEKVLVLEGAMTQYLNEKLEADKTFATALEYGTAVALGVVGGIYANEIIQALQKIGRAPLVQTSWSGVRSVYESVKGSPAAIADWISRRGAQATTGTRRRTTDTVSKSTELYRRTVGFINTPSTAEERRMTVFNYIYRVINSPQLAKGYSVAPMTSAEDLASVRRMKFVSTGIPGFRINQSPNRDYLVGQLVSRGGEMEYYKIYGVGIRTLTQKGEDVVIPPQVMTNTISERLQQWGRNTKDVLTRAGAATKETVQDSRPYKYVTTDPFARQVARGVAVGAPITAISLLALRPIDTSYITISDYVRDLEKDGINIDRFVETQRAKASAGRM